MRALLFLVLMLTAFSVQAETARILLVVFEGGTPARSVTVHLDGGRAGETDDAGALRLAVPAGEHQLELRRNDRVLGVTRFSTTAGRPVQVIASLPGEPGASARFDLEGAQTADGSRGGDTPTGAPATLTGTVVSVEDGEPVSGARIYLSGLEQRLVTDESGGFRAEIPAGNYQLSVVHPDFASQTLSDVGVTADAVNDRRIELSPAGLQLAEYTVSAPYVEGSVASVFSEQRESAGVSEVLGVEQMSRAGDSDAADALGRVTGLTIEDGKYVVIRGQPARYTQTLWNGSPLPSPDPIRRIVPLDLFPTGVLSSIQVEKSYDAARPGSFGGGLIRLETAGVPESGFLSLSASTGGRDNTLGEPGLDYEGGGSDMLGVDDGTRALPSGLVNAGSTAERNEAGRDFSDVWAVEDSTPGPDAGLGISGGARGELLGADAGFRLGLDWSRSFATTETIERDYALRGDGTLVARNDQVERRTDMDVDSGGLMVGALEWENHELRSNTFFIRKTTKRSEITEGTRVVSDDLFIRDYLLDWNERELFAQQFIGHHELLGFDLDWRAMTATSSRYAPDRRDYIYRRRSDGTFVFYTQNGARRRYTESDDTINSFSLDLGRDVMASDRFTLNLSGGVSTYVQDRESQVRRFRFDTLPGVDGTQSPDVLLDPDGLGSSLELSDDTQTNDNYIGDASVDAAYVSADLDWTRAFRLTLGLRQETADFLVTTFQSGGSQGGTAVEGGFERSEVLPSLAATWRLSDDMQLRFSASRTVSRPVLNELSPARYYDPESGDEYLGNPDLLPATIDGLDLRWEWYPTSQEAFSFGLFAKDYTDPIEQSFVGVGGSSFLRQVQNASGATVSGIEASARTELPTLAEPLFGNAGWAENFYLQINAAVIDSEVELARQDLATSATRPLQGQADSVQNLQFGYDGERHDATLSYNRVGRRLQLAGVQGQPDVYQEPTEDLGLVYSYSPGDRWTFKLSLENLLDTRYESYQGGELYRAYNRGRKIGLSASWKIGD